MGETADLRSAADNDLIENGRHPVARHVGTPYPRVANGCPTSTTAPGGPSTTGAAAEFLVEWAQRMKLECAPDTMRSVLERACGGQLHGLGPDGGRASTLTLSGIPFEASVSGGRGEVTPAVRYVTETATQRVEFDARLAAQLDAIGDLVEWLPNGDDSIADMLRSFVAAMYPEPGKVRKRFRSATWLGIVHHIAAPQHLARLKVYGSPAIVPGTMQRLGNRWPAYAELASTAVDEKLFKPSGVAIEVDARGEINHKLYLRARLNDVAVPMKLVRLFGEQAWEALSELESCGLDPAGFHRRSLFVCCTPGGGFALHLGARRGDDLTATVRELATRHYGCADAVDAFPAAAESVGASWRYSAIGLGSSADHGIDKLNVYGTPTWDDTGFDRDRAEA